MSLVQGGKAFQPICYDLLNRIGTEIALCLARAAIIFLVIEKDERRNAPNARPRRRLL